MNVEITGRHVVITPAIRDYVNKRLKKFNRVLGDDASFHVIIDVEKERHTAEIILRSKLLDLTGKGETSDMYSSILRAIEKIERQALKHKSKIIEGKRQRAKAKSLAIRSGAAERERSSARGRWDGVQLEEAERKPMTVEEAALELGHSELPFVVFRERESESICVLYKRKDGMLALVQG